ncbi:ABC transporter ATP-binding protein [Microbacterium kribbense]|uniref:ABC transporter ATP-binding protein n=1 Tax=Microbacterium kribbense TaxID=433645 RepID=A0ABP7GPQ8_9MICO
MISAGLDARILVDRGGYTLSADLQVAPGEVVAVMGPSGAGKSTLFGAITGMVPLRGGHVRLDEQVLDAPAGPHVPPNRRGIVLLGQEPRLFPHLTARENVAFGLRARRMPRQQSRVDADRWLQRVGLAGLGRRRPAQLSGGQQQRVALARALAIGPRVLLLDEPLTSLDPDTAGEIRTLLREQLDETGTTTLIATHDAVDAVSLAERLVIVEQGRVTQEGPVREVLRLPQTGFAAAIAGIQRLPGTAEAGLWRADGAAVHLASHDAASLRAAQVAGAPLVALVHAADVRLRPAAALAPASEPGRWTARVTRLEQTLTGVRVHTGAPEVAADVSVDAVAAAGLAPGRIVALQVDPAEVRFTPAGRA